MWKHSCGWWGNPSDSAADADLVLMIRNKEPLGLSTTGRVIPRAEKGGARPAVGSAQAPGGHAGWEAPSTTHASYHNPLISHSHSSEYRVRIYSTKKYEQTDCLEACSDWTQSWTKKMKGSSPPSRGRNRPTGSPSRFLVAGGQLLFHVSRLFS